MNGQLREITKETITQNLVKAKRPLSKVLETRHFGGVHRRPESNDGVNKESSRNTVKKEMRREVETCFTFLSQFASHGASTSFLTSAVIEFPS